MRNSIDKIKEMAEKITRDEVHCNINGLVEYILTHYDNEAPFTFEDIENLQNYEENQWGDSPKDILEWWVVSRWLGEKLYEHNECIIDDGNNIYWGRTTSGQYIYQDTVIKMIADETITTIYG